MRVMSVRRWWARWRSRRAPWVDYSTRDEHGGWMFGVRRRVGERVLEYREVATLPAGAARLDVALFAEEVARLAYNMERTRQRTLGRRPR
jgi:hypothetical protein